MEIFLLLVPWMPGLVWQSSYLRAEDENYTKQDEIIDPITGLNQLFGSSISFEANNRNLIISPNVDSNSEGLRSFIWTIPKFSCTNFMVRRECFGNYFGIDHALSDQYLVVGSHENNAYGLPIFSTAEMTVIG